MKSDLFVLTILFLQVYSHPHDGNEDCFEEFPDRSLACAVHYERRTGLTDSECKDFCLSKSDTCKGAVYLASKKRCDLFKVAPTSQSNGYYNRAQKAVVFLVRFRRVKRYGNNNRRPDYGAYGRQTQPQSYGRQPQPAQSYGRQQPSNWPIGPPSRPSGYATGTVQKPPVGTAKSCQGSSVAMTNCPGFTYYKSTGKCSGSQTTTTMKATAKTTCKKKTTKTTKTTKATTEAATTTEEPTTSTTEEETTTAEPLPDDVVCDDDQVTRFLEVPNTEFVGGDDFSFDASSEETCYQACADNQLPDGTQAPCKSAQYADGLCLLSENIADPDDYGNSDDFTYFEKICVDADLYEDCPGPFFMEPNKILVGFATTVVSADSFEECLESCIQSEILFNFRCASGSFFDVGGDNCILSVESAQSQPDLYIDEFDEIVQYFEPRCVGQRLAGKKMADFRPIKAKEMLPKSNRWGPWTNCDPKTKKRSKFRSCKTANPTSCKKKQKACQPETFILRQEENGVPMRNGVCDVTKTCCPLLKRDGTKDCARGRKFRREASKMIRSRCVPTVC